MKRHGLYVIALLIVPTIAAFAAGTQEGSTEPADGVASYKMVFVDHGSPSFDEASLEYHAEVQGQINERLVEDLGFTVDIDYFSYPDDTFVEKVNLDVASGRVIDFIRDMSPSTRLVELVDKRMATDLTPYIDANAPAIAANIPDNVWSEVSVAGKVYGIPMPAFPIYMGNWVRGDWLDVAGLELPTTVAEYEDMLKAFRDGDFDGNGADDTVPMAGPLGNVEMYLLGVFTDTPGAFVDDSGTVLPKYFDPGYREFVSTLRSWYNEGLIDDSIFNADDSQVTEMYSRNIVGVLSINQWHLEWGPLKGVDAARPEMATTFLPQLDDDVKGRQSTGIAGDYGWIPATSRNPQQVIEYYDWVLYNEDNYDLVNRGIRGTTWNVVDGMVVVPEAEAADATQPWDLMGRFMVGHNFEYNIRYTSPVTPEQSLVAYKYCAGVDLSEVYVPVTNFLGVPIPDEARLDNTDAETLAAEYIAAIIRGERPMSAYEEMLGEYENLGGLEMYDVYTAQWQTQN